MKQTQAEALQGAEEKIFDLRKKAELFLRAGDVSEVNRIELEISGLQRKHGAMMGIRREKDERTA